MSKGQYVTQDPLTGAYAVHNKNRSLIRPRTFAPAKLKAPPAKEQAKPSTKEIGETSAKKPEKTSVAKSVTQPCFSKVPLPKDQWDIEEYEEEQIEAKKQATIKKSSISINSLETWRRPSEI